MDKVTIMCFVCGGDNPGVYEDYPQPICHKCYDGMKSSKPKLEGKTAIEGGPIAIVQRKTGVGKVMLLGRHYVDLNWRLQKGVDDHDTDYLRETLINNFKYVGCLVFWTYEELIDMMNTIKKAIEDGDEDSEGKTE